MGDVARKGEEEGEGGGEGGTVGAKDRKRRQNRAGLQPEKEPSRRQEQTVQRPGGGPMEGGSEKGRAGRKGVRGGTAAPPGSARAPQAGNRP